MSSKSSTDVSGRVSGSYSGSSIDSASGGSRAEVSVSRDNTTYTASASHESYRGDSSYGGGARVEHSVSDRVSVEAHGAYDGNNGASGGASIRIKF
jgi:hypothetical protein